MTTPASNDNVIIEILAKLNIDTTDARRQITEMMERVSVGAGRMVSGAAGAVGAGGKVTAEGDVKGADERSKVRTAALSKLAQQFPGGGLMTQMASSYKGGGMMAGMATGMTAAVGILSNIMKSSQVFQTLSGTVFKVLGFMADMFLMPFVPMMMKFVTWMLTNMPAIQRAGEKTADFIESIARVLTWGRRNEKAGQERGGFLGNVQENIGRQAKPSQIFETLMTLSNLPAAASRLLPDSKQQGGVVSGGPGEKVPTMLHGGEIVVPQDIAAGAQGMSGRVAAWIQRFQQKEMGPGGVMDKWYDQMFGHSILPDIWKNISGLMGSIESEARSISTKVAADTVGMDEDNKSFWDKFKFWEYFSEPWEKIKDFFGGLGKKVKDFFTFDLPDMPAFPDFGNVFSMLTGKISDIGSSVLGFFTDLPSKIPGLDLPSISFTGMGTAIKDKLREASDSVYSWFTDPTHEGGLLWGANKAYRNLMDSTAISWTFNVGAIIKDCFNRAKDAIWNFFSKTIPGWAKDAANSIIAIPGRIWGGFGNLAGKILEPLMNIKDTVKGLFDKFGTILSDARDRIWAIITGWGSKILSWVPGIGGGENQQFGSLSKSPFPGAVKTIRPPVYTPGVFGGGGGGGGGDGGDGGGGGGGGVPVEVVDTEGYQGFKFDDYDFDRELGSSGMSTRDLGAIMDANASYEDFLHFGNIGGRGNRAASRRASRTVRINSGPRYNNRSIRTLNVTINSSLSVADIVNDIDRLESMNEASFFNGVM